MKRKVSRSKQQVSITWLGHSAFKFELPSGFVFLVDPWLENPKAPPGAKDIARVDAIFISHGHADHIGNAVEVAKRTGARVFANYEVSVFLRNSGISSVDGMNKSGTVKVDGVQVTMVDATHSSGIETGEQFLAGGDPAGFVFRFENGFTAYHAGDTGVFGDMRLIAELYKPDLAILPIGGFYTMGPLEAAKACRLLMPAYILGMHYGTFPVLAGNPQELKRLLPGPLKRRLLVINPGDTVKLP